MFINMGDHHDEFVTLERNATYHADVLEWYTEILKLAMKAAGDKPITPDIIIVAARAATVKCDTCSGTGRYQWGVCLNGVMTHSGPCFRCQQKGRQGQEDFKRNWYYDNHRRAV